MYFPSAGKSNTAQTIACARQTAAERGIRHIVVASNTGDTARQLAGTGAAVICVTHAQGFVEPGQNEMSDNTRQDLSGVGIRVLTGTHVLSGVERGISNRLGGAYPAEIMAHTLRMFGQGTKVAVEIAVMALDAGLIPHGEPVLSVGGTGRGADTVLLLRPAHADHILDTRVLEVICKPAGL